MTYLNYNLKSVPTGIRKLLYLNWPIILLVVALCCAGFLMLYSIAGGNIETWAEPQMKRFAIGMVLMFVIAMVPIWIWKNLTVIAYLAALALLLGVELFGHIGMGAQRWLELGPIRIQPSEPAKIAMVMMLAAYYDWLPPKKVSHPFWVLVPLVLILLPAGLVFLQPNLGTAMLIIMTGGVMMWVAGVHWAYFATVVGSGAAGIWAIFASRGTSWQFLHDYQYRRIDTFLNPSHDPLGAGYNINQATIALGSGGLTGRGFMQGTQSRLNFLPEKQTDFIFNTLAEEFGFIGSMTLLVLYGLVMFFCLSSALSNRDRYSSLVIMGISTSFFALFAVNMMMVMGLAPVVGVPLPLVSYGGSQLMVMLAAFGLLQSAHVHRPR
ncbi:rod shape determining protein RodA [Ketogulonicigenium robustum]|uniref:Peptidoglycan glycosyltransferase MrdB n=1 Tax=Ketogulonicigenium robustum TaxID=92947 RepID=A0A1W6NXG2_9RHOB|nr:rod shape-determining protein RodA [Ketogulonicigenium robustum]ARO13936.1 rod shape determining protein RodA [Ketogulonicigenium robustum]